MPDIGVLNILKRLNASENEAFEPLSVDFFPKNGEMFIQITNLESYALRDIAIQFNQPIPGPSGDPINRLNIFKNLKYLAPGRLIDVYAGRLDYFLQKLKHTSITVRIRLRSSGGKRRTFTIEHDLSIYTDLPYKIEKRPL